MYFDKEAGRTPRDIGAERMSVERPAAVRQEGQKEFRN